MGNNALGAVGESKAASYLKRHGYNILETNYRCRAGEIDIIARKNEFIVFVEVKARKDADFAEAKEYVTYAKQQRIIKTAMLWFMNTYRINHIENAFM